MGIGLPSGGSRETVEMPAGGGRKGRRPSLGPGPRDLSIHYGKNGAGASRASGRIARRRTEFEVSLVAAVVVVLGMLFPFPALAQPEGPRASAPFILVLDPGHGGRDPGSKGASLLEKDFTLRAANFLAERLGVREDLKVVLTREGDVELTTVRRAAVANFNGASLMISLQADASWTPGARGPSVLVAAPQRPPAAADEPPGAAALRWERGQNVHLAASRRFAQGLRDRFSVILGGGPVPVRALPLRNLEGARLPSVYVSLGVISTPEEEARLREMNGEDPYLGAIAAEVLRFAGLPEAPPEASGEAPAEEKTGPLAQPEAPSSAREAH